MEEHLVAWLGFGLYAAVTVFLAVRGMRKTKDLAGFALGNGDLGPILTGITLAAAIASTATFVINPGFVYAHGVSALMHLGVASFGGVLAGLVLLSPGFRHRSGKALTLPHWIGARYGLRPMQTYFALLNLLLAITFVVLIVKGSALVMQHTLGTGYLASLSIIVVFVFGYVLMGGTYAHVYTNALQGGLMILVALAIVFSGVHLLGDGLLEKIGAQDPDLLTVTNPKSPLFASLWDVFACGFVVGLGLVAQPHILTKALYLRSDGQIRRYLLVGAVVSIIYALVLVAGLYARAVLPAGVPQDAVIPAYLAEAFSPLIGVGISVTLLAAGMSTLDGILVSASTIAANDLFRGPMPDGKRLALSRYVLIGMGAVAFVIALKPPELVGIFAQVGIYGLVAASLAPVALGVLTDRVEPRHAFAAAVVGPLVHFGHYGFVVWLGGGVLNPAVSATSGVLASFSVVAMLTVARRAGAGRVLGVQEG